MGVSEIERAIEALPSEELAELTAWFAERDGDAWDKQIEADARAGKLDALAAKARASHRAGKSRPLSANFPVPTATGDEM
jgi:hypothetical protein